ncbi:hypothetical protein PR048_007777 [Dryococelus australis]|uniref:Reverse transcriptase domain-containing protein n=1 Tax=Dryococelus australis TaxID=614101 RepID=A0ABQ9HVE0_9NEOP|nr:hypothetical protein PR048_007777 [Dryococelus australis]
MEQVNDMNDQGIIESSNYPYNSHVVLVPKKGGKLRFCINYKSLNEVTHPITPPAIDLSHTLRDIGKAKIFCILDIESGYRQIAVHLDSRKYTAFRTPEGETLQFHVMPFSLKNAPATFQQLMSAEVLTGYISEFCFAYLNDVIIYCHSWEECLGHLQSVLEGLKLHGMTCKLLKSFFGKSSIDYLGHAISPEGSFRQHKQRQVFSNLKNSFTNIHQLHLPQGDKSLVLQIDACQNGLGTVLYQQDVEEHPHVIVYASTRLNETEQRYHINKQECLGYEEIQVISRRATFHSMVRLKALKWRHKSRNSKAKLGQWDMFLTEFDF